MKIIIKEIKRRLIPDIYVYEKDRYDAFCELSNHPLGSIGSYNFNPWYGGCAIVIRKELSLTRKVTTLFHEYMHHLIHLIFGWNKLLNKIMNYTWEIIAVLLEEIFYGIRRMIIRSLRGTREYTLYYWRKKNENKC